MDTTMRKTNSAAGARKRSNSRGMAQRHEPSGSEALDQIVGKSIAVAARRAAHQEIESEFYVSQAKLGELMRPETPAQPRGLFKKENPDY